MPTHANPVTINVTEKLDTASTLTHNNTMTTLGTLVLTARHTWDVHSRGFLTGRRKSITIFTWRKH